MTYTNGTIYCENYILDESGNHVLSPGDALMKRLGWSKVISRKDLINSRIRAMYSAEREFEVIREREENPDQFEEYDQYVKACIQEVDELLKKK